MIPRRFNTCLLLNLALLMLLYSYLITLMQIHFSRKKPNSEKKYTCEEMSKVEKSYLRSPKFQILCLYNSNLGSKSQNPLVYDKLDMGHVPRRKFPTIYLFTSDIHIRHGVFSGGVGQFFRHRVGSHSTEITIYFCRFPDFQAVEINNIR